MWYENFDLRAKIKYLPHTGVVMSVDFLDSIDDEAYRLYPSLLSDDWHSFSIQICNQVYSVPTPLSTFLEAGWTMEEEYAGRQLQGADESYESYDDISVWLTNENGQKISVSVCNTSKNAIDITQGTVGYLHVIYGNLDFSGADLQIPGGLMLGWSTKEDIAALYGRPYEAVNDRLYTYQEEGSATSYYRLGFSEEGFLEDIAIRNLPYGREQYRKPPAPMPGAGGILIFQLVIMANTTRAATYCGPKTGQPVYHPLRALKGCLLDLGQDTSRACKPM